ncbi:uncharacterized protein N7483_002534 [Penicillium malachiteum]|uniref:uncharacterized protein n=1 Tax=Penicillium malachiteum TaxID=1324776 RepID=UPI0025474345|nr:uncharacterized protein N7483_002534 [Penicillium malachiteum]KAJ5737409.1 hypothetical protein N7483_002534 [Penicillium malachiteum]
MLQEQNDVLGINVQQIGGGNSRLRSICEENPRVKYDDLLAEVDYKVCRQSIWRLLRESNLWKWLVLQRPELKPEHVAKRLQWALRVRDYTPEKWKKVFWSDESTVERGKGSRREHTFTRPKDQIALRDIQEVSYKGVKQMFWAAFSGSRRHTGLIPLSGDPDSPRGGVN